MLGGILLLLTTGVSFASDCQFVLGFKALRDLVGHDIVGACMENEHYAANGDSIQHTAGGMLVWRKADNWTAFTDGYRTWISGPHGLQQRLNTERFAWEPDFAPGGGIATPARAPTSEIAVAPASTRRPPAMDGELGYVVEVITTTSIGKTLFAWFIEAAPSLSFGEVPEGWSSVYHDPPRNEIVLNEMLRNESADVQAASIVWQTVMAFNAKRYGLKHVRWNSGMNCLNEMVTAGSMMAQWWLEKFGPGGMQNASTGVEIWINEQAQLHQNQTLGDYVHSHPSFRAQCARFGQLPAMPSDDTSSPRYVDPAFDSAFAAMRKTDAGEEVYQWFLESGASALFAEMGDKGGIYDGNTNDIFINVNLKDDPESAAAWLVHEIVHAALAHSGKESAEACYEEEEVAFSWQAQWWMEFFGPSGSGRAVFHDRLLALFLKNSLSESIRASEHYQQQCDKYGTAVAPMVHVPYAPPEDRPLVSIGDATLFREQVL